MKNKLAQPIAGRRIPIKRGRRPAPHLIGEHGIVRIQLDIPQRDWVSLEKLMQRVGFTTRKELFMNALTLFGWGVNEASAGRELGSLDRKNNAFNRVFLPGVGYERLNETRE